MVTSSLLSSRNASDFRSDLTIFSFFESSKYSFLRNPAFGMAEFSLITRTFLPFPTKNAFSSLVRWVLPLAGSPVIMINGIFPVFVSSFFLLLLNSHTSSSTLSTNGPRWFDTCHWWPLYIIWQYVVVPDHMRQPSVTYRNIYEIDTSVVCFAASAQPHCFVMSRMHCIWIQPMVMCAICGQIIYAPTHNHRWHGTS